MLAWVISLGTSAFDSKLPLNVAFPSLQEQDPKAPGQQNSELSSTVMHGSQPEVTKKRNNTRWRVSVGTGLQTVFQWGFLCLSLPR